MQSNVHVFKSDKIQIKYGPIYAFKSKISTQKVSSVISKQYWCTSIRY